ncbi:MAG: hypothetical protein KDD47_02675, partial [Acidobacteria bacterium]|nr:hypothetical protein [Acidobacteriota bacterium]
ETAQVAIEAFRLTFDESMFDPPGDSAAGDVSNPASYLLLQPGLDLAFDTAACGPVAGDDVAVVLPPGSVAYDAGTHVATLSPGAPLGDSLYRLHACAALRDLAGNALDGNGDGTGNDDFVRRFRVDVANRFANGNFDCDLGGWTQATTPGATLEHDGDDAEGSPESGSALGTVPFASASPEGVRLSQCVAAPGGHDLDLSARFRITAGPTSPVSVSLVCEFYPASGCSGAVIETKSLIEAVIGTVPTWQPLVFHDEASPGSVSARCALKLDAPAGVTFEGRFDRAVLLGPNPIFSDGFESGDTSAWSATVGGLE